MSQKQSRKNPELPEKGGDEVEKRGSVADITVVDDLMIDVVGFYVVEYAGYDNDPHRRILESNNNIPVIPGRKNCKTQIIYDKNIYKLRKRMKFFLEK